MSPVIYLMVKVGIGLYRIAEDHIINDPKYKLVFLVWVPRSNMHSSYLVSFKHKRKGQPELLVHQAILVGRGGIGADQVWKKGELASPMAYDVVSQKIQDYL